MPITLSPSSTTNRLVLPAAGVPGDVSAALPLGIYSNNDNFLSGASDQVAYTYRKLGGDILDIELSASQVYAAYEDSTLEYSYIVNIHQAKNVLSNVLGNTTGSFNEDGQITGGELSGSDIALRFPKFDFAYARRVTEGISAEVAIGGMETIYSASFARTSSQQDYNLQAIISSASANNLDNGTQQSVPFSGLVGDKKILIKKVYYRTSRSISDFCYELDLGGGQGCLFYQQHIQPNQ